MRGDEYFLELDFEGRDSRPLGAVDANARCAADREPLVVDAKWRGAAARFFNHACAPNLRGRVVFAGDVPCFAFFALRDVARGRELSWDYKYDRAAGPATGRELLCKCGYANCRGRLL